LNSKAEKLFHAFMTSRLDYCNALWVIKYISGYTCSR